MKLQCPKCKSEDIYAIGGMHYFKCRECGNYWDDEKMQKEHSRKNEEWTKKYYERKRYAWKDEVIESEAI